MDVIKSLFSDFASTSSYKTTTALISQGCRRWAHIVHDSGSVDAIRKSQILSPRLNLTLMDVINPNDKRFNCHEFGIDISRFVSLAYVGIRRAELEYERDQWARQVFQSVDSNNDHFISFEQFSKAFSTNTIPQIPMRQLRVLFDRMTQEASTQQMSLDRFRQVCCQLTHVMFVNNVADDDSDDHLRPAVERIIEKWTRLDPAYNKFIELMCSTESGFDICQRLSYARLKFEGALIYGSTSQKVIEKYCTMLGIIAEQQQDKSVFRSSSSLINDINRLEQSVDQRLVALMGPGSTKSS